MAENKKALEELSQKIDSCIHIDSKKALKLSNALLRSSVKLHDEYYKAEAYLKIGFCHYNLREMALSKANFEKARMLFQKIWAPDKLVNCINSLGALERQSGNYSTALKLYFEALKISEEIGVSSPTTYNNIATIYFKQKDYKKALKYYSQSLKLSESAKGNNSHNIIGVLVNIGNIHLELKEIEKAIEIFEKARDIGEKNQKSILIIPVLRGLGSAYFEKKMFQKAYDTLKQGIDLSQEANYYIEVIKLSLELSNVLKVFGEYEERKELLKKSLSIAIDYQNDLIYECLHKLHEHYQEVEDIPNAYEVLKQISKYSEKKHQLEKEHKLSELQTRFESREKDKLISQEKLFNKELEKSNLQLKALNQELEQFNYAVSHDLKEPIRSVKAYVKLLLTHAEEKMNEEELEAVHKLEESIQRMQQMIDDLLEFAILGNTEKSKTEVDLNEVLEIVKADLQIKIKENNAKIESDKLPTLLAHKSLMVQLFQNIINNSIKFKKPNLEPQIQIRYSQDIENHILNFIDNGVGIPQSQQKNVFKLFKRLNKTNSEGSGIGLSLCQKIITKMQGQISLASSNSNGATFTVTFPKN